MMASFEGPAVARAGSGVCYGYFEQSASCRGSWIGGSGRQGWKAVIEFAPEAQKTAGPVALARRRL